MLKIAKAIYKDGKLVFPQKSNMPKDGTEVVVVFEKNGLHNKYISLYGIWKGKISDNIDEALKEMRSGWKKRLENVHE